MIEKTKFLNGRLVVLMVCINPSIFLSLPQDNGALLFIIIKSLL